MNRDVTLLSTIDFWLLHVLEGLTTNGHAHIQVLSANVSGSHDAVWVARNAIGQEGTARQKRGDSMMVKVGNEGHAQAQGKQ